MTIEEAINHAKEIAGSKCDECGKEHQQLAEWLQELKVQRDRVDVLTEQASIYEANIKKYQESLMYYMEEAKKAELKIASYEDKTPISDDFLVRNGFELQKVQNGIDKEPQQEYIYCNDVIEISAELRDEERGIWRVWINFLDECCPTDLDICTIGQLKMFLAIEDLAALPF